MNAILRSKCHTFNLYQLIGDILTRHASPFSVRVLRNDQITLQEIYKNGYEKIVLSPGPGNPSDPKYFGVCAQVLTEYGKTHPVLGVCLGMQGMAHYFGGRVVKAEHPMHGKTSSITHNEKGVFTGLPQHLEVMRYHSLVAEKKSLPKNLAITAVSQDTDEIMGLRHIVYPIEGVQFHPESFATEGGSVLLSNFLFQKGGV